MRRSLRSLLVAAALAGCTPIPLVPIAPLPHSPPLDRAAKVVVLPPYEQTFSVSKTRAFEDKMLAEAAAATGSAYPQSLRASFFTMFADRLRARIGERGGPTISLLPPVLWAELEKAPVKYVAHGAQNISYGSAFRVPSLRWLRAHGIDADYLVAPASFTGGAYTQYRKAGPVKDGVQSYDSSLMRLTASVRLMVWDTRQERMIDATTVLHDIDGNVVSSENWRELAERSAEDFAQRRIFGGAGQPDIVLPGTPENPGVSVTPPQ